jgi:hypothetical protein
MSTHKSHNQPTRLAERSFQPLVSRESRRRHSRALRANSSCAMLVDSIWRVDRVLVKPALGLPGDQGQNENLTDCVPEATAR